MDERNRKEIEKMYLKLYPMLFEYARSSLSNDALAEEAVQDTFIIALQKSDALCSSPRPEGWLVNTLKYVICNTQRSQAAARNILIDYCTGRVQDVSVEDPVDLDLLYGNVADSDDYQLLKEMAIEERSYQEMADARGITVVTCRKRVQRAKELMRKKIKI